MSLSGRASVGQGLVDPSVGRGRHPEGILLALRRELDAFREGNYVPIINTHY